MALTGAALAAQEYMLEKREGQLAAEASKQTPSKSFDKTTQSQILQRYLQELADIEATYLEREDEVPRPRYPAANDPCISVGANVENASHPYRNANARPSPDEQHAKRRRVEASVNPETKQRTTAGVRSGTHQSATREPLRAVPIQRIESAVPPSKSNTNIRLQAPLVPAPLATFKEPIKSAPKVTDFTFQVVGQHQLSFQERLAAWQAREAEAARLGKPVLQPLALRPKDPIKEARKADKPVAATRKQPVIAKEFNWHSDKRARERKDWEERLREKEEILAELAEIKRLEAEAAEMESIKKMRAAQVPIAHPVPAFARSRKRRQHEMR